MSGGIPGGGEGLGIGDGVRGVSGGRQTDLRRTPPGENEKLIL